MKKYFIIILINLSSLLVIGQKNKNKNENLEFQSKLLQEVSINTCKCLDSISTYNKSSEQLNEEIVDCIQRYTSTYSISKQLLKGIEGSLQNEMKGKDTNIVVNTNEESKEFEAAYKELENNLLTNCPKLTTLLKANDELSHNSLSENEEAMKQYNLGDKESEKNNYKKAIKYYKKAIELDPNFTFAYDNIGVCYRMLNDFDNAEKYYLKSIELNPNGKMPLQNLAVVYQYKNDIQKAIETYEKLYKLDPNNPEVPYGLGIMYLQHEKNYEKSLENLIKAYKIYSELKSPYVNDAQKAIKMIYDDYKSKNKLEEFKTILKNNGLNLNE